VSLFEPLEASSNDVRKGEDNNVFEEGDLSLDISNSVVLEFSGRNAVKACSADCPADSNRGSNRTGDDTMDDVGGILREDRERIMG
jgi:hypothetical protein